MGKKTKRQLSKLIQKLTHPRTTAGRLRTFSYVVALSDPARMEAKIATHTTRRSIREMSFTNFARSHGWDVPKELETYRRAWSERGTEAPYWRLYPYGIAIIEKTSLIMFDRNYCPIVRLSVTAAPEIIDPHVIIRCGKLQYFYEDATAPYRDEETLDEIEFISELCRIEEEIFHRQLLSNFGRRGPEDWCGLWVPK